MVNGKRRYLNFSLRGATIVSERDLAYKLLQHIAGTDNMSIESACKMIGLDVVFRAGKAGYKHIEQIKPNHATIENIRIIVLRGLDFFKQYGPMIKDGFTFEGAYTLTITSEW